MATETKMATHVLVHLSFLKPMVLDLLGDLQIFGLSSSFIHFAPGEEQAWHPKGAGPNHISQRNLPILTERQLDDTEA